MSGWGLPFGDILEKVTPNFLRLRAKYICAKDPRVYAAAAGRERPPPWPGWEVPGQLAGGRRMLL